MLKKISIRLLAIVLTITMMAGMVLPIMAEGYVDNYSDFLTNLEVLEQYAEAYATTSGKATDELIVNFIRTGVERYRDDNWTTLAGQEITAFVEYVSAQDAANGTTAMNLRDIIVEDFKLPNGNQVDFGHMFGTMNIACVASVQSADLGGWAGDLCDLILFSKHYGNVPAGTIDEMADFIRIHCFGVDADDAFGMDDFYGDLDAYYLMNEWKKGESGLYDIMSAYFTDDLDDVARAAYFMNNRFKGQGLETREDVREAVYDTYCANAGLKVLEAKREIAEETELRQASCYAFADYLFNLAGHLLDTGVGGEEGEEGGDTPGGDVEDQAPENGFYSVFSSASSTLAPGITQTIRYATTADKKQIVYYVATVDVSRDDVTIMVNYKDNDPSKGWGFQRVEDQAKALMEKYSATNENFNVIVATNADGYNMSTGEPGGLLVMDGKEWKGVDGDGFFAILKDGSAMLGDQNDYATYKDQIQEAVGGFGAVLVKDGQIATTNNSGRASRTAIGITAEGKVVMMVLDGRQEPFSAGGSMAEIAQIMFEAGCVDAINLDGGGSTTYLSKPEGSDTLQLVNRPSDGYARSVATSLVAISTAKSSKEFDHANITSEYDYLTINTSLKLTATGVSNTGYAAEIPEGAVWQVSDAAIGSVTADGEFTALANGDVEVQLVANDKVIGSKTLHVVVPDALSCTETTMRVVYDTPTTLPLLATYNGNPVAVNPGDFYMILQYSNAGHYEPNSFDFVVYEESGYRALFAGLALLANTNIYAMVNLNVYRTDEAYFDFDDVTAGDRQLAWNRDVSNSETTDGVLFQIIDTDSSFEIDYTFALDMTQIDIPEKLEDLVYMLPGAGTSDGGTAWDFLLQLAERVSTLTEVTVTAQFDPNMDVDVSNLKVFNDFFTLKSCELDENNKLTVVASWIDQTQAVDSSTANPICILTGIKMTPKAGSTWNSADQLVITNRGDVSYNIFLRASSLYNFACNEENQIQFGLLPFVNPDVIIGGNPEAGASFGTTYATFSDDFILDKTNRQGWHSVDTLLFYYVDNVRLTGIQKVPGFDDPTTEMFYEFGEDGACLGTVTGMIELDGDKYYAVQGVPFTGWRSVLEQSGESYFYYFDPYNGGKAANGKRYCDGFYCEFEDYKLVRGEIVKTEGGLKYRFASLWLRNQWLELDGNKYFIQYDYFLAADGVHRVRNVEGAEYDYYLFDENGVWLEDVSGFRNVNGKLYEFDNGVRVANRGLMLIGEDYYYFKSDSSAAANEKYWVTDTNGLLPPASYKFDEEGKMIDPPKDFDPAAGILEVDGVLYYYENLQILYGAGLIQLEDGSYIYVRTNGQLAVGEYWPTNTNDLLPYAGYIFGEDGKLVGPVTDGSGSGTTPPAGEPEEPADPSKNGIFEEENALYYYVDGVKQIGAGLVKLDDGAYIYVRSNGQLAVGVYWPTKTNDLLPYAGYTFGDDGKMIDAPTGDSGSQPTPPETPDTPVIPNPDMDEIVEENGALYYYADGVKQIGVGLVEIEEGKYIYVRSNGQLAVGDYWPTKTNDLMPYAGYTFGNDGIMIDPPTADTPAVENGFVSTEEGIIYYINGERQYGLGLIYVDGNYYYIRSNGYCATGSYYVSNHNNLLPADTYYFRADGRLWF